MKMSKGCKSKNAVPKLVKGKKASSPKGFAQEWRIALRWGLADDIATGQPQAIMDRCAQRAGVS